MAIEDTIQLLSMSLEDTYKLLLALEQDPDREIDKQELDRIRFGVKIPFDLHMQFTGMVTFKHKADKVIIGRRIMSVKDYFSEIEAREAISKSLLLRALEKKDILNSR